MARKVITIGREFGSGGRIVAQKISQFLGIPFYDRSIINMAADSTGLSADYVQQVEQQKTSSFLYNLYMSTHRLPVNDQVFLAQSNVIRKIADEGSCVIVGRCADYILRENTDVLSVFVHAPLEERIRRAEEQYKVESADTGLYVRKQDKNRAAYYEHFTDWQWGQAQNYDLAVSSSLGLDEVARMVCALC